MTVKIDIVTALLVNDEALIQLEDAYGGESKDLTINTAMLTINGGFLVELIVEMTVGGYKGLNVYICLFDKDGRMGSTIRETL
jgi:hypothetical protein